MLQDLVIIKRGEPFPLAPIICPSRAFIVCWYAENSKKGPSIYIPRGLDRAMISLELQWARKVPAGPGYGPPKAVLNRNLIEKNWVPTLCQVFETKPPVGHAVVIVFITPSLARK